jgi:DNA-binding transcriptional LysR family regulator
MGTKKAALSGPLADADIRLLRVFMAVVDAGGFSAAEIQLNLANSTISNYISDLEKRLQMKLCQRGRAGFALTEHGHLVYQAAQDLVTALEGFRDTVNHAHNRLLGELHLGLAEHILSAHNACIVQALTAFAKSAPEVIIHITTLASDDVASATVEGKVDFGITALPHAYAELATCDLFDERMQLYCGTGHTLFGAAEGSLSSSDLAQQRFVESPRFMRGREAHADMIGWPICARAHHQEARAALILSGQYLGFLPQHLVQGWGLEAQLWPLETNAYAYTSTFTAIWRQNRSEDAIIDAFLSCLLPLATATQLHKNKSQRVL